MSVDYGTDFDGARDLNTSLVLVSGRIVLTQALYRRLITPRGGLLDDPNYGLGVQLWINESSTPADVLRRAANVDAEFRKDERVISSKTTGVFVPGVLTFSTNVVDGAGPFRMVVAISSVSVTLLSVS